jgi:PAS domain S-box-containing protein
MSGIPEIPNCEESPFHSGQAITEADLKTFFDLATDILWVLDENGTIIATNANTKLGYAEGELQGRSVLEVHPPETRAEALRIVTAMLRGEEKLCPLPLLRKDGSHLPVETRVTWGKWGGHLAVFGSSRDVSEVLATRELFRKAFDMSPALMAFSSIEEGRFLEVNKAFLSTLGFTPEEVLGKTSRELGLYRNIAVRNDAARQIQSGERKGAFEVQTRTRSGQVLDGLYTAQIIHTDNGDRLFTVMIDLTQQRLQEKRLKQLLEMEELLVKISSLLIATNDDSLGKTLQEIIEQLGAFLEVETAFICQPDEKAMFRKVSHKWSSSGRTPVLLADSSLPALMRGEELYYPVVRDLSDILAAEREYLLDKGITSCHVLPIKSGSSLFGYLGFQSSNQSVELTRENRRLIRVLADNLASVFVRNEQWLELQLATIKARQAAQEADQSMRSRSEWFSMISHEIRTPMNSISVMSHLLMETKLDQKQRGLVNTLHTSGQSLLDVVDKFLDYSKIEAGTIAVELERFSPRQLIHQVLEPWRHMAGEKGIDLAAHIDESIPRLLVGDTTLLRQICGNLLGNALKFTKTGSVTLSLSAGLRGHYTMEWLMTVKDTGVGIPPDFISSIFAPFSRGRASINRESGGTGLGLAIVKKLVDLLGGSIDVESREGEGSCFTVRLPLALPSARVLTCTDPSEMPGHVIMILKTPDEDIEMLRDTLECWGFGIMVVEDRAGLQAIDQVRAATPRPEAVILSPQIAEGLACDGMIAGLRNRGDARSPFMFVMSGPEGPAGSRDSPASDRLEGADGFIEHPISPSRLYDELVPVFERLHLEKAESIEIQPVLFKGNRKALVVDDNEANIEIVASCLKRMGIETDRACSGEEALQVFGTRRYDLVVVDLTLGGMDGFETVRRLRKMEQEHDSRIPMFAMSAALRTGMESRLQAAGFSDFISKPVNFDKMEDIIVHWLLPGLTQEGSGSPASVDAEATATGKAVSESEVPRHVATGADRSMLASILKALLVPVKDSEPALCDPHCARLRSVRWTDEYADRVALLSSHVDNFRFEDAQILIESLLGELDNDMDGMRDGAIDE